MKKLALVLSVMTVVAGSVFAASENFSFTTDEMILVAQATEQEYTVTVKITKKDGSNGGSKSYKVTASSSWEAEGKAERMAAADCSWGESFTAISCSPDRKSCYSR